MARKPMVSRTITTTRVNVFCLNIIDGEPCNRECVLPRTFKDEKKLKDAAFAAVETDDIKPAHIVSTEVCENLYGMTEEEFIHHAHMLPPRTSKEATDEVG